MPERVRIRFDERSEDGSSKKRKRESVPQSIPPSRRPITSRPSHRPSNDPPPANSSTEPRHSEASTSVRRENESRPHGHVPRPSKVSLSHIQKAHLSPLAGRRDQHQHHRPPSPFSRPSSSSALAQKSKLLQVVRRDLPIWSHQDEIRQCLRERDVLLLVGETGSGKSTQVPQFLLNESWCRTQRVKVANSRTDASLRELPVGGCIAVTEPRRVAAISLARRVAAEMGSAVGSSSPASQVGYSVRFDNSTSPSTRIKFLTEGMLLQELLRDPWLRQYSAVVIDEVHERGVNVDLVVGFLRNLVVGGKEGRGGHALKVVVMSATADLEVLCDFFEAGYRELTDADAPTAETGETVESESSWSGISESEEEGVEKKTTLAVTGSPTDLKSYRDRVRLCSIQGRQYPVQVMYAPAPVQDLVDGTLRTIMQIHCGEAMPGDILVFLTGQEDIEAVERLVMDCNGGLKPGVPKIMVRPLFAALPQHVQQEAFLPAPHGRRKVVLATNIAETSVTVPGVRYVVDGGKAKIKQFRSRLGLDSLLAKPISKSSSMQRKGRAGREAPGKCYRLYTERDYLTLEQSNTPEISRCDITPTVLTIKARGVEDILSFPFLTPPPREALEKALMQLWTIGALDESGGVSLLGAQMARLPLDPALSRVLLAAASPDGDCLLEVIDIISCLTVENLFLNVTSEEQKEEAEAARRELIRREGDHLTLLTTIQKYGAEETDRRAWAERHFVSHRAMQAVTDVRKQLRAQCRQQKLLKSDQALDDVSSMTSERASTIMKCFLKGFASKTARLCGDGSYKTMMGNHAIAIHPSSSLFGRRVEAIVYNEYLFTNKSYAKGVSAVQMDWIMQALGVGD